MATDDDLPDLGDMGDGLGGLADMLGQIREVTSGHRAALIADYYSETAAEAMAVDAHREMCKMVFALSLRAAVAD